MVANNIGLIYFPQLIMNIMQPNLMNHEVQRCQLENYKEPEYVQFHTNIMVEYFIIYCTDADLRTSSSKKWAYNNPKVFTLVNEQSTSFNSLIE